MRLARFNHAGSDRLGIVVGAAAEEVADLGPAPPEALVEVLAGGSDAVEATEAEVRRAPCVPVTSVRLLAPVPDPGTFLAIGLNYAEHVAETSRETPAFPLFFNKQVACVTGPGDPIHVPRASSAVDYEGELAVMIGRPCRHVPVEHALEVVGGYLCANDVTVRDWQQRSPTMTLGKSWDTHGPIGPWVVTPDEVPDPQDLRLRTRVSGEILQDASTNQMIHDVAHQIAVLSTVCTLRPGDLISTGTPAGVGVFQDPPRFLVPGDEVAVEIAGIGTLTNPVIAEPDDTAHW